MILRKGRPPSPQPMQCSGATIAECEVQTAVCAGNAAIVTPSWQDTTRQWQHAAPSDIHNLQTESNAACRCNGKATVVHITMTGPPLLEVTQAPAASSAAAVHWTCVPQIWACHSNTRQPHNAARHLDAVWPGTTSNGVSPFLVLRVRCFQVQHDVLMLSGTKGRFAWWLSLFPRANCLVRTRN